MKIKILILLVILTSFIGYMEWGDKNHSLLIQAEYEVIRNLFSNPLAVLHPITIIPLFGQLLLFISLFLKKPNRILIYTGVCCLGMLMGFLFAIGLSVLNLKMFVASLPFILFVTILWKNLQKLKKET
ncbi:MAG: hypothetical protein IPM51_16335 [Sphingobacteriaceae bacterium]|nr:hypothetical protein [Sphingobacteriaceae bacterium]